MDHYAGIDVSLERSSICVVDAQGKVLKEAKVAGEPEALIAWLAAHEAPLARIGLEAGPLSQWLFAGMKAAGLPVELLETRHVRDAFKAMPVKTDRKDARGIAQLMRLGWFRPVHCKSLPAQEVRALLTARRLLRGKRHDIEMSLRGTLRGFGLKVGPTTPKTFEGRVRELVGHHGTLHMIAEARLKARAVLAAELKVIEQRLYALEAALCFGPRQRAHAPTDDDAGRGGARGADLCRGHRRSGTLPILADGRGAFRADAPQVPVRRDRRHRAHLQDRRP